MLVNFYKPAQRNIPEDSHLHLQTLFDDHVKENNKGETCRKNVEVTRCKLPAEKLERKRLLGIYTGKHQYDFATGLQQIGYKEHSTDSREREHWQANIAVKYSFHKRRDFSKPDEQLPASNEVPCFMKLQNAYSFTAEYN
jgi:hypothetical protein